ncbi:MAG: hypothetical protein KAJ24_00195 [Candidatus Aenigmarchaeota archaeon]|nr:hypothetical protein [Candidatus Aenigmarchaeota archaeon]
MILDSYPPAMPRDVKSDFMKKRHPEIIAWTAPELKDPCVFGKTGRSNLSGSLFLLCDAQEGRL